MFRIDTKKTIDINTELKPGIYKIFWIKNGQPQAISRILGEDKNGLLYIGKADGTVGERLNQFRCTAFLNSTNHSAGLKYRKSEALKNAIKKEELLFVAEYCNEPLDTERKLIKKYRDFYGEVPPLNG